jgi:hypothetical protein
MAVQFSTWGELLHNPVLLALIDRINSGPECLWGVWLGERLVAVYIDKGYGHRWRDGFYTYQYRGNEPVMKLGVNLVVFALSQKGGIARQVVDYSFEGKVAHNNAVKQEKKP